jgi:integrase
MTDAPKKRGKKSPKGTAVARVCNNRMQITMLIGKKREVLSLNLSESKRNWEYARMVAGIINNDRLTSTFDKTLDTYRKKYGNTFEPEPAEEVRDLTISDVWTRYKDYKRPQLSPSTIAKDYAHVSSYIEKFEYTSLADAVAVRDWLVKNAPAITARRVMRQLNAACKWAVDSKLISINPFLGMAADLRVAKTTVESDIEYFSMEERDRILEYLKATNHEYSALIEFMFRTGARPGECAGLQWMDIDREFKKITFDRALVLSEDGLVIRERLKTQERRIFPCGEGLAEFLRSIVPEPIDRSSFVFKEPDGKYINTNRLSKQWKKILIGANVDYKKLYCTRHTYITFCLDAGMNPKDIAKLCGNSAAMIFANYAGVNRNLVAPDI